MKALLVILFLIFSVDLQAQVKKEVQLSINSLKFELESYDGFVKLHCADYQKNLPWKKTLQTGNKKTFIIENLVLNFKTVGKCRLDFYLFHAGKKLNKKFDTYALSMTHGKKESVGVNTPEKLRQKLLKKQQAFSKIIPIYSYSLLYSFSKK